MCTSGYGNEAGGIRLLRLINTQSVEIAKRELENGDRMCLYCTGQYWVAFEHSAYFLKQFFPKAEVFTICNPNYPFTIIATCVTVRTFNRYMLNHTAICRRDDYVEFSVSPLVTRQYGDWHARNVDELMEMQSVI